MRVGTALAMLAAVDLTRPENPRFGQQPFSDRQPRAYRGRNWKKRNPKREAQAAAKRARKITKRSRS